MATAADKMLDAMQELVAADREGRKPATGTMAIIQQNNMRLLKYAVSAAANKELPTNASANGEFTHPFALMNLMAERLAQESLPLSDEQVTAAAAIGDAYDVSWTATQKAYTPDTWGLDMILDELVLKQQTMKKFHALLSSAQRAKVILPDIADRQQMDLYSPVLMIIMNGRGTQVDARDQIPAKLAAFISAQTSLPLEQVEKETNALGQYAADIDASLKTAKGEWVGAYLLDDGIVALRAYARAIKSIVPVLVTDPTKLVEIRTTMTFPVYAIREAGSAVNPEGE
jgi:hypothetical protein